MVDESSVDERWPLLSGRDSPASGACSAGDVDVRVIPVQHDCPASPSGPVEAELAGIGAFEDSDSDCDPDNPRNWPAHFKWSVVLLLTFMSFTVTFTCISVIPVASRIASDLSTPTDEAPSVSDPNANPMARVLLVTIWELGEAFGPVLIAPLSEMFGRYPVFNISNTLFLFATIASATATHLSSFALARCLNGLAVASNVLNPAVVGDMFPAEQRGAAMSLVMLAPLVGGAVGPAIGGALAQGIGWRGFLGVAAGLAALCELGFAVGFRETYITAILARRARTMKREVESTFGDARSVEAAGLLRDAEATKISASMKLWSAIMRPIEVLFGSGVLMAMSLYGSVVFAYFYVLGVTFPDILERNYGFEPAQTGTSFMAFSVGSVFAILACNRGLDSIYVRLRDANGGIGRPEFRLPLAVAGAVLLPAATCTYGWTAELALPFPFVLITTALIGFSLLLAYLPLVSYVVDAFGLFAASAMTGMIVLRCLMSTFLPLAVSPLVETFGYGWGFTILCVASLLLVPVPLMIMRFGHRWRQLSVFTREETLAQ